MHTPPTVLENPVAGRYVPEARLGAGGMGNVLRARDLQTGETVALKLLEGDATELARARFQQEVETLSELRASGIVAHLGHGFTRAGQPFVVMEWIDGEDLGARLLRGILSVDEVITLLRAVTGALVVAHRRGIIHRDLKPSNLMLRGGRLDQPVLIDFGVARRTLAPTLTRTGTLIGTPVYMAPEQARGERELLLSTDVFSLGCVAFHCLVGCPPFAADHIAAVLARILFEDAPSVCALRADVPGSLGELIGRMLSREPSMRPADADALHRELAQLELGVSRTVTGSGEPPGHGGELVLEQQLFSVLVGVPGADDATDATLADIEQTDEIVLGEPAELVQTMGGRAERMWDGTIVAVFASHSSAGDRARVAARCALELHRRWPGFQLAVATGRGHVHNGRAFGEAVERAHRLLDQTDGGAGGEVLVDALTADLLDGRFEVGPARNLVRELPGDGAPRQLLGKPLPCLGRTHELGMLELTLRSCIDDREAHLVIVTGEPGCGKSRLRHEFVRRCLAAQPELALRLAPAQSPGPSRRDLLVLRGEGDPMTTGSPFAILGRALASAAGLDRSRSPEQQRQAIAALVDRFQVAADRESTIEFLTALCNVSHAERRSAALRAALRDPSLMRERCLQAWVDLLRGALVLGPVLVIAEDLHWGDRLTIDALLHTQALLADSPLLVLGLARGELFDSYPELRRELERGRNRQRIRLTGLARGACERLIRHALAGTLEPSDTLVERLIVQASGNALYLEELIRAAAQGGSDDFPTTVSAMLQARMEQLDRSTRRTLLAASVLGQRFSIDMLAPMLDGIDPASLQLALERLIDAEMLEREPGSSALQFRHALLRDTAYLLLAPEGARALHRIAAEQLLSRGDADSIDAMLIAEHLFHAGLGEQAAGYYLRAAEQASGANALDEALRRAQKGLACSPTGEVAIHLAAIQTWALGWLGQWGTIVELAETTLERLAPGSSWWSRCIAMLIGVGLLTDDDELLSRTTARLLAPPAHEVALVPYLDALNVGLGSGTMIGRYRLAARYHQRAREVAAAASEVDDDARRLLAFADATTSYSVACDPEAALQAAERAVALAHEVGDGRYLVFSRMCAGQCLVQLGRSEAGIAAMREAHALAQQLANPYLKVYAIAELANELLSGDPSSFAIEESVGLSSSILEAAHAPPPYPGWALATRARARLLSGDLDAAEREAGEALRMLGWAPRLVARAWLTLAAVHRTRGALDRARAAAEAALEVIEPEGGWELELARAAFFGS